MAPKDLVQDCIRVLDEGADVVLIPYVSIGEGYWTRCRCFESLFYQTREFSMPRFFKRNTFMLSKGFDPTLNAGEDAELLLRLINHGCVGISSKLKLTQLEKTVSLTGLLRKDIWAMPYVSKYLRKRSTYSIRQSGARFPLVFISKVFSLRRQSRYLPGLFLLKSIDYICILLSWMTKQNE
jgi:arabinofuranan 3-O-arabinosyltransferase